MNGFKLLTLVALAAPAIATAQVGPNPAVSGGSLDPTVGGSVDTTTDPQDARTTQGTTGNVLNRSIDSSTRTTGDLGTTGATTGTSTDTNAGVSTSTTTRTKATTKPMKKAGRR